MAFLVYARTYLKIKIISFTLDKVTFHCLISFKTTQGDRCTKEHKFKRYTNKKSVYEQLLIKRKPEFINRHCLYLTLIQNKQIKVSSSSRG